MKKVVSSNWLLTIDVLEMVSEDTKGDVITSRAGKQKFSTHGAHQLSVEHLQGVAGCRSCLLEDHATSSLC